MSLRRYRQQVEELTVEGGEVIIYEGRRHRETFVVLEGRARITRGEEVVGDLGPRDVVRSGAHGESSPVTVTALTPMRILVVEADVPGGLLDALVEWELGT